VPLGENEEAPVGRYKLLKYGPGSSCSFHREQEQMKDNDPARARKEEKSLKRGRGRRNVLFGGQAKLEGLASNFLASLTAKQRWKKGKAGEGERRLGRGREKSS